MNLQEAFDAGFDAVKAYVDCTMNEFGRRLAQLEAREPLRNGRDGIDGKSVTVEDIRPMVEDVAAKIVSEAKAMVRNYVDSKPQPKDGKDATPEQIADAVSSYLGTNPPKDGESIKGDDGRGIKDALIDAEGNLVLSFTDGELKAVGRVKGEPGDTPVVKNGEDGKDGLGFEDMIEVIENDGRSILRRYTRGEQVREFRHTTGWMIYRGVFKEEHTYERGDVVTWAGSLWHCNVETSDKPGDASGKWTLAAKKGRDGQDGVVKQPKPDGPLKR